MLSRRCIDRTRREGDVREAGGLPCLPSSVRVGSAANLYAAGSARVANHPHRASTTPTRVPSPRAAASCCPRAPSVQTPPIYCHFFAEHWPGTYLWRLWDPNLRTTPLAASLVPRWCRFGASLVSLWRALGLCKRFPACTASTAPSIVLFPCSIQYLTLLHSVLSISSSMVMVMVMESDRCCSRLRLPDLVDATSSPGGPGQCNFLTHRACSTRLARAFPRTSSQSHPLPPSTCLPSTIISHAPNPPHLGPWHNNINIA